jgi:hypothetical protein
MSHKKKNLTPVERKHQEKLLELEKIQWAKENKQKLEAHLKHPGHKMPTTRRDFLEVGFYTTGVTLLGPSLATLLSKISPEAHAATLADCPVASDVGPVAYIHIHVSGGMQQLSLITPKSVNNERLDNYSRLGLGVTPTFVDNVFGNTADVYDNVSNGANAGFLSGLRSTASAATLKKVAAVTVPYKDNGDSDNFPFSIMGLISASGRSGSKLNVLGTDNSATGVDAGIQSAYNITPATPLRVQNLASITQAVQLGGALAALNAAQKEQLALAIQNLSDTQKASIQGISGGANAVKLIECATGQNYKNAKEGAGAIDPVTAPNAAQLAAIWNNFQSTNNGGKTYTQNVYSLIAYNVLQGNAAAGGINIGGHDIHASHNDRIQQEQSAFEYGALLSRIFSTAELLNKKVFVHLTTNGSVVNNAGTPTDKFNDDDNNGNCTGGAHFFMFDPAKPNGPAVSSSTIGGIIKSTNLNQNARVDATAFTSLVQDGQASVFLNYDLFSTGTDRNFERVLPNRYSAAQKNIMKKIV